MSKAFRTHRAAVPEKRGTAGQNAGGKRGYLIQAAFIRLSLVLIGLGQSRILCLKIQRGVRTHIFKNGPDSQFPLQEMIPLHFY